MWNWLLDNWWAATALPYLAFNAVVMWVYCRDTGDRFDPRVPADWVMWTLGMVGALVAIVAVLAYCIAERIVEMIRGAQRPTWSRVRRWLVSQFIYLLFFCFGAMLYGFSLAITDYAPGPFEAKAMLLLILIGAAFGTRWLEKEIRHHEN